MKVAQKEKYNEGDILKAAKLYQHVGKYKEALAALDVLLARDAANEEALEQKKSLYLKTNDVDGAAGIIQIQINQNPTEGTYYAELAQLYDNNKLPEKAKELYSKIEKDFGDEAVVQYHLAGYYKKNNDIKKYEQYVKKLALNKTINTEMRIEVLRAYIIEAGNDTVKRKEGIDLTENIVAQYPEDARMHSFYGDVLLLNQQDALAVEQYKRVVSIDPSSYYDWEKVLQGYTGRNDADSLLKYSEKALRLFPNQAMVHYLNGIGYLNKQNYNNCIKAVNRAIDMQPEDKPEPLAQMYTTLGDAYYFIKQYNLSDSSFEHALKLQPGNLYVLNNYSYYLSVRGTRLDDAERMSKKTIELSKDEPSFLDTYGWILYKQSKYDKALEYIQKAIDVSGESADGTLWEHLGDVNYKLGNIDKAVSCWMKAKEKGTENIDIDKKIKDRKLYES
jgi:tetratricopeptide (TPR) repeat protein